jgi:hypothetical protein
MSVGQGHIHIAPVANPDTEADAVDTVVCAPDDGWKYHPQHVEQFPDINKVCNVASCWIYVGILLGAHQILHISRVKVNIILPSTPRSSNLSLI